MPERKPIDALKLRQQLKGDDIIILLRRGSIIEIAWNSWDKLPIGPIAQTFGSEWAKWYAERRMEDEDAETADCYGDSHDSPRPEPYDIDDREGHTR